LKNILLVDDSKVSRTLTRLMLEKLGYVIVGEAVDGRDGIEKFNALDVDLILTDIEMPNLDGLKMIAILKEQNPKIHIIALSSIANSQMLQEALKYHTPVIRKPLKEEKFLNALALLK
jgi:two-component system chemotaxis response regulator CheY